MRKIMPNLKKLKLIGVISIMCGAMFISDLPIQAVAAGDIKLNPSNGISIGINAENGTINSLQLASQDYLRAGSTSGFYAVDEMSGTQYPLNLPVTGSATYKQEGIINSARIKLSANYTIKNNAIFVDGTVTGTTTEDRAITLEYRIPLKDSDMYFYDDFDTKRLINSGVSYSNVSVFADQLTNNIYPFTTISDGKGSITVGAPSDALQLYRVKYENERGKGYLVISFSMGLTAKALKTPNKSSFSFFIYSTDASTGMRSAAEKYYSMFPHLFTRRVTDAGNWMFQQNYSSVAGLEDFGFKFNETPISYELDKKSGIVSFMYVAPTEQWIGFPGVPQSNMPTPQGFKQKIEDLIASPDTQMDYMIKYLKAKDVAQAIKNTVAYNSLGDYSMAAWYGFGLPIVEYVCNGMPSLPGINKFQIDLACVREGERLAKAQNYRLGGIYIDNTNWVGGIYGFDYRDDNFKYADFPIVYDFNKKMAVHLTFAQYRYIEEFVKLAKKENKVVLGNIAYPKTGAISYAHLLDLPGGEIGPTFSSDITDFRLRRALTYKKPWVLLYTQVIPTGGIQEGDLVYREQLLKKSMVYGIWANTIGLGPSEETYNQNRAINRKYTPIIKLLDKTGWEPIQNAKLSGNSEGVVLERFGSLSNNNLSITSMNTYTNRTYTGSITVDLKALGGDIKNEKKYMAFDLVNNRLQSSVVDTDKREMVINISLPEEGVGAYTIGTTNEIFNNIKDLVFDKIKRSERAISQMEYVEETLPEGFAAFKKDVEFINSIVKKSTLTAKDLDSLIEKLRTVTMQASKLYKKLEYSQKWMTIDLINMYSDAYDKLKGLYPDGVSSSSDPKDIISSNRPNNNQNSTADVSGYTDESSDISAGSQSNTPHDKPKETGKTHTSNMPLYIIAILLLSIGIWSGVGAVFIANKKGISIKELFLKGKGKGQE